MVYCLPQCRVDLHGSVTLETRQDVRISVERDCDGRVAEALANDPGVHAPLKELRSMGVPKVVEAKMR